MGETEILALARTQKAAWRKPKFGSNLNLYVASYYFFFGGDLNETIACLKLALEHGKSNSDKVKKELDALEKFAPKYKTALIDLPSSKTAKKIVDKIGTARNFEKMDEKNNYELLKLNLELTSEFFKEFKGKLPDTVLGYLTSSSEDLVKAILIAKPLSPLEEKILRTATSCIKKGNEFEKEYVRTGNFNTAIKATYYFFIGKDYEKLASILEDISENTTSGEVKNTVDLLLPLFDVHREDELQRLEYLSQLLMTDGYLLDPLKPLALARANIRGGKDNQNLEAFVNVYTEQYLRRFKQLLKHLQIVKENDIVTMAAICSYILYDAPELYKAVTIAD